MHQREPEGEEQAVERVDGVEAAERQPLDDDPEEPDDQRREDQRRPVADAERSASSR